MLNRKEVDDYEIAELTRYFEEKSGAGRINRSPTEGLDHHVTRSYGLPLLGID